MALRQYIASYMIAHTHTDTQSLNQEIIKAEQSNPNPKIYSLKQDIFKYFIESQLYLEVPQFIPTSHLIKAIAALKGVDQRTIKKYVKLLESFGCIKRSVLICMNLYRYCTINNKNYRKADLYQRINA